MLLNVVSLFKNQEDVEDLLGISVNFSNYLCASLDQYMDSDVFMFSLSLDDYFELIDNERIIDAILRNEYHLYYELSDHIGMVNISLVKKDVNIKPQGYIRLTLDMECQSLGSIQSEYKYTYYDELAYQLRSS